MGRPPQHDSVATLHAMLAGDANSTLDVMEIIKTKYVGTNRDTILREAVNRLLASAVTRADLSQPAGFDNRMPGLGLVIVGETGVGKSIALKRLFDKHPVLQGYDNPTSDSPLISLAAPSPCTSKQLARAILMATGYRIERDLPDHRLWEMALNRFAEMKKFVLHIDELQHVTHNVSAKDQPQMADTLKNVMFSRRISLILSGVPTLIDFVQFDPQLFRRLSIMRFDGLTPKDHPNIRMMLENFAAIADLKPSFGERAALSDFLARLCHAGLEAFGYVIVLTHLAIEHALSIGSDALTTEHFAAVFAQKSGFAADRNPFVAPRWHEINCTKIFEKPDVPEALARKKGKTK